MADRLLSPIGMKVESRSYIDAFHAVLQHQGWFTRSKAMLAGMTAFGFRQSVHRQLKPESSTAYNWMAENFLAADLIGVTSSQYAGFTFLPTFPLYREYVIGRIKASIDCGTPAIFWRDRFVVACGYNDEAKRIYYKDGIHDDVQQLPYDEYGSPPYYHLQVLEEGMKLDPAAVYKESFLQAIYKWEEHELMLPREEYACGGEVYQAILDALASGDYDADGAEITLKWLAAAKRDLADYMAEVEEEWREAGKAAAHYRTLAGLMERVCASESTALRIRLLQDAYQAESLAIRELILLVREAAGNRFDYVGLR
ncbi:hypothetical protein [Paenibacillus gorillae]|uniref:hypothetical protein n=1 Tax=Paenibacillus gorillae TaxID=1243662 RepID=UPI0004AE21B8|nr:hypothetical protein [Paenibacillus gorillae]